MYPRKLPLAALAAACLAATAAPSASAQVVPLTGVTDFDAATVFRSFFGGTDSTVVVPGGAGRLQVNGDENGGSGNNFGIYTVFDVPAAALGGAGVTGVNGITLALPPAVNANTGAGGIQRGGDLSVYYTTDDTPVADLQFVTQAGPPFVTPTGFGDQFAGLTLLSSETEAEGVRTITRDLDLSGVAGSIVSEINAGDSIRLLVASQTPGSVFQLGTGNPPSSTVIPFSGDAPTLAFDVTAVPEPAGVGLLALGGLLLKRRR